MTQDPTTAPPAPETAPAAPTPAPTDGATPADTAARAAPTPAPETARAAPTLPAATAEATAQAAPTDTAEPTPAAPADGGDVSLLALVDRLADLLGRSDLSELEVESGGTGLVLRKPSAIAAPAGAGAMPPGGSGVGPGVDPSATDATGATGAATVPLRPSVKAPLTGIFYTSPSPGAPPYVQVGGEVAVGQLIGLIEAMKLFNEIKSDLAGRVVRVAAESGALVKAKQPLIEVDPL
jgi:acetyl-CoA carboxylase biotin carboxyl carrier protein